MNSLDKQYQALLKDILDNGVRKEDRTGTGTLSVFGRQIRHKMSEGFPLLTTKKMYFKGIVTELLWFLRGDTNIKYLVDNDCHIWDGDAYKNFEKRYYKEIFNRETGSHNRLMSKDEFILNIKTDDEFAKEWGELGPVYGKQWRDWKGFQHGWNEMANTEYSNDLDTKGIDQIANSIHLLKTNPDSRRNRVSSWNVGELGQMVLPPCHTDFQFYTRELSFDERAKLYIKNNTTDGENARGDTWISGDADNFEETASKLMDEHNTPTRAISLMWNQRSVDTFLGLPFNIASYGLLLEIIAKMVNMVPDELIGNLGDTHLYLNHIEQAKEQIGRELGLDERVGLANNNDVTISNKMGDYSFAEIQLDNLGIPRRTREPYPLPTLKIVGYPDEYFHPYDENLFEDFEADDFVIENYQSHPAIKAPLSN